MNDIDFIPEWYKADRKKMLSYRRQYATIVFILVVMVVWSFNAGHSVSKADAKINQMRTVLNANADLAVEHARYKNEADDLQKKAQLLEQLDHKTNFAAIFAELSFLVDDYIVLSKLDIFPEKFQSGSAAGGTTVKIGNSNKTQQGPLPEQNLRFKVVIAGIAADAANVAILISKLEESEYFCNIVPGFSKSKEIKEYMVTEFQITCFVANYLSDNQKGDK